MAKDQGRQVNIAIPTPVLANGPIFILGIVLIPIFDTLRVFAVRIWRGKSPFAADKTHIHHLLTNAGYSHAFAAKLICCIHGFILLEVYWLRNLRLELLLIILIAFMLLVTLLLRNIHVFFRRSTSKSMTVENLDTEMADLKSH